MEIQIYFDGAILRNGQPNAKSGIGVVVKIDGKTTHEISEVVQATTSNQCEWEGLLCALDLAVRGRKKYPDANICLYGDSKMVVEQINDRWQHDKFMLYYDSAINMKYAPNSIKWIPREQNEEADILSAAAIGIVRGMPDRKKIKKLVEALAEATHLYEKALSHDYGDQNYGDSIDDIEAEFDRLDKWVSIYHECANEPTGLDKLMDILKDRHNLRT